MDGSKTNEEELTSTMGNLMSTGKEDKNDSSDSTPTSSTDAFTTSSTSRIVADDPISSTSSDISEKQKGTDVNDVAQSSTNVISLKAMSRGDVSSPIVSEKDLLDMNITDTSTEKITENVDDIVQDLENLLGEPTTSFDFMIKPKEIRNLEDSDSRNVAADLDQYSVELQMLGEQTLEPLKSPKDTSINIREINMVPVSENQIKTDSIPKTELKVVNQEPAVSAEIESSQTISSNEQESISETVESSQTVSTNVTEDQDKVESSEIVLTDLSEQESTSRDVENLQSDGKSVEETLSPKLGTSENCQSEVVSDSNTVTETGAQDTENTETDDITSTLSKSEAVEEPQVKTSEAECVPVIEEKETENSTEITNSDAIDGSNIENVVEASSSEEKISVEDTKNEEEPMDTSPVEEPMEISTVEEEKQEIDQTGTDEVDTPRNVEAEPTVTETKIEESQSAAVESTEETKMEATVEESQRENVPMETESLPTEIVDSTAAVDSVKAEEIEAVEERTDNLPTIQEELPIIEKTEEPEEVLEDAPVLEKTEAVAEEIATEEPISIQVPEDTHIINKTEEASAVQIPEDAAVIEKAEEGSAVQVSEDAAVIENDEETSAVQLPEDAAVIEKASAIEVPEEITQNIEEASVSETTKISEDDMMEPSEEVATLVTEGESSQEMAVPEEIAEASKVEAEVPEEVKDQTETEDVTSSIEASCPISNEVEESDQISALQDLAKEEQTMEDVQKTEEPSIATNLDSSSVLPTDFQVDGMELATQSLSEDLDLLVQNTVDDSIAAAVSTITAEEDKAPTFVETLEKVQENNLSLAIDEVPDLEILNAISNLSDNKSTIAEVSQDALLGSSEPEVPFETSALPTVDEILTEGAQQQEEIQDDNLETLLAVASLQNVDYNITPVEDYTSPVEVEEPMQQEVEPMQQETVPVTEEVKSQPEEKLKEPLVINIEENSPKEKIYSPKITIKPIKPPEEEESVTETENKGSLKMTITKQADNTHSILKIYNPEDDSGTQEEPSVPKLIIKPLPEQPQSPKMSTRSSKVFSPSSNSNQRSASPRITIKPIVKPEEAVAPLKITIKPVLKPDDGHKQKHSPKLTIKPIVKPEEEVEQKTHSPRVTIKPIVKPPEEEQLSSPRITIKPIVKPAEETTPRVTIKPVVRPAEEEVEKSPKITIKPIVKPAEEQPLEDFEESIKERIVLKINKGTIPGSSKRLGGEEEKSEKLAKIKLKFSKEGGHPQIVQDQISPKRPLDQLDHDKSKRQRLDEQLFSGATITPIMPSTHSKLKEMLSRGNDHFANMADKVVTIDDDDDDVTIVEEHVKNSPIVISEESNQDSMNAILDMRDPISEIPVFEITPESVKTLNQPPVETVVAPLPAPRKRGRPRKVPLQVREDFKDPKEEEPKPVVESTRPKRSCRGQSVRTTLGIKPRKPRGPGRGRGGKRGMGTRGTPTPPSTPPRSTKEPKLGGTKLKELKEESFLISDKSVDVKTIEIVDDGQKSPLAPPHTDTADRADIVMYEEETRMSAETSSRAQTPAKQVVSSIPTVDLVEESQSSVQSIQSTATTESVKVRRGPRLEVHQEPEGAVISADQLAEYYWSGGGPYMLQEQVAQFLGIKSFKRKYPNIARRVVDMQERDFIRESGLAAESMCDLGLTAVNSSDILDIMYSDFQDKYEEYCKHQRDRQAKDLINKQKALTLAASQEKAKMDITQQAVQSAASWNANFNKTRRDQRKSCMDLQTLTIHFPKGKTKQINKPKIGNYPVALVPGQFTDYYRDFTPTELNNLPLNTLCYNQILRASHLDMDCDSQTDGSGSDSDSSSSDSDSSFSGSSDGEDCTLCKHTPKRVAAQ